MITGIFDSHAHYDDPQFDPDREALLAAMHANGIWYITNIGADLATSHAGVLLANTHDYIYTAVGVHPQMAQELPWDYLAQLEGLAQNPRVRAIGEIGLDYFRFTGDKDRQKAVFREQLGLAKKLGLPVVIHDRDAHGDVLEILEETRPAGVVHCFSGSAEVAEQLVKLGFYIGFTGVITFKNARHAVEAARVVPLERLLIETDCPYLSPEPNRGKRCDSSMLEFTATRLAEIKGISPQALADQTRENACRLYGIR